jgi:hypothetical protein
MILLKDKKLGKIGIFHPTKNIEFEICWNWKSVGFMLFFYPDRSDGSKAISLQFLWPHLIFIFTNGCAPKLSR